MCVLLDSYYERSESAQDKIGKYIYQFQPETKTFIWNLKGS